MSRLATASKFSVLRIDDDSSDEEGIGGLLNTAKKNAGGQKSGVNQQTKKNGPAKKRGKKKPKVVPSWNRGDEGKDEKEENGTEQGTPDPDLQQAIQASMVELKSQEDVMAAEEAALKCALAESQATSNQPKNKKPIENKSMSHSTAASKNKRDEKQKAVESVSGGILPSNSFLKELEKEAKRVRLAESKKNHQMLSNGPKTSDSESVVLKLYVSKLEETCRQIETLGAENQILNDEAKKYKDRYKKLCQLLRDSEVKEKVQLVVDLEKSIEIREELTAQIQDLSAQLEQARSKIHQLEDEQRHTAAQQSGK